MWSSLDLGRRRRGSSLVVWLVLNVCAISVAAASNSVVSKCCLADEVFSVSDNFTCAERKHAGHELHPLSRALHENFACSETANLTVVVLDDLAGSTRIRGRSACLDFLYDGKDIPVIFQCRANNDDGDEGGKQGEGEESADDEETLPVPRLSSIRICCDPTYFYDPRSKQCTPRKHRELRVAERFNFLEEHVDFVSVLRGPPRCQHALVDYLVNVTENPPKPLRDGTLEIVVSSKNGPITVVANETNSCLGPGDSSPDLMALRLCSGPSFCEENKCIRKCCPEGEAYFKGKKCRKPTPDKSTENFHSVLLNTSMKMGSHDAVEFHDPFDYGLLVGITCEQNMFPLDVDEVWRMNERGHMDVEYYRVYEHHEYCTDFFFFGSEEPGVFLLAVCFDDKPEADTSRTRFDVNAVLELISCAFLIVTLLVYICLPVLQNLHGKTLMCHVASLIVAYASTAGMALQIDSSVDNPSDPDGWTLCKFIGYTVFASWTAAFSWLNVMCFDIWWTFGGLGGASRTRGRAYKKRFLVYSLYAWGLPLLITSLGVAADFTEVLPKALRPNIGTDTCWFEENRKYYGQIIFFLVPIALQLVTNVVFFALTALYCNRVKAEISRVMTTAADPRKRRFHSDRTKLIMNVKLFIVMGVSWTLELISALLNQYVTNLSWRHELFYVADVVNSLQGVLIFMLFVLKSKVYYALRRRLSGRMVATPASNGGTGLQDPYRVRKSVSSSTIMSTFAISASP